MDKHELLEKIRQSGAKKVKVAITDIDGILRGKYINIEKFTSALESGFGFCNVIFGWVCNDVTYDNVAYTGWHSGYPDAQARIDPATYRQIPWDQNTPFFLADFVDADQNPLSVCPRQVLKQVIARARDLGYEPLFGLEFEFFNFDESPQSLQEKKFQNLSSLTPGMFGYSLIRSTQGQPYFSAIIDELAGFGVPVEGLHTETGPGVYEAGILYSEALEAADRAVLFKTSVKEIGARYGIIPTFMARWNNELPGSSGHLHQSLRSLESGANVFYDQNDPNRMSPLFQSYLAGQIHCLADLLPFFAPTVNSYKRLVEGFWAPTRVNWGLDNRTTALRVISGSSKSTRLETRVGGADINPYLAVAAALAAGLYGIEKGLRLKQPPVKGNGYADTESVQLAANLKDAAEKMKSARIAHELFGAEFIDHFANTRLWEWRESQKAVTSWELERYFEII